jgi:two-component sensor histidine kinase
MEGTERRGSFTPYGNRMPLSANARRSWLILPTLAIVFAIVIGSVNQLRISVFHTDSYTPWDVYTESLARWLGYALLAPLVGALVRWRPLTREVLWPRLPLHLAAGLAFAVCHTALEQLSFIGLHMIPPGMSQVTMFERLFLAYFAVNFLAYLGISGAYHVIRYHKEMVAKEQIAASLRARLAEARLEGLRAQLNPHFLFNTLNAISALALSGDRDRVVQTLSDLSDLLRVSFDSDLPQEIPLERELAFLDRYIDIQRTRFGDRLTIEMDVQSAARRALLPSMMLQPLVENALQHGISAHPGPGRVVVRAHRENGNLCLRVENTGPGFGKNHGRGEPGVGLGNTRARLEELYGEQQRLLWGSLDGGGAYVEVSVPYRSSGEES